MMKRAVLFIPLILFIVLGALLYKGLFLNPQELPSALIGKPFPEFNLEDLHQPDLTLSKQDIVGKVSIVNVWATWCPSCRYEHPYLMELAASQQVPVIGLNYKDERDAAQKWLKDLGNPYSTTIYDVEGTLGLDLGVYGAPETFIIDQQGIVRMRYAGIFDRKVWTTKFLPVIQSLNQ